MQLLFDENLSPKLVMALALRFPGSRHVGDIALEGQPDDAIWQYARREGLTIVSKDDDFRQRSFLLGAPPKVIWLKVGNCGTRQIADLLRENEARIRAFEAEPEESLLILRLPASGSIGTPLTAL
jgi:predicted nuclease of predicted toxin-antitoxin system